MIGLLIKGGLKRAGQLTWFWKWHLAKKKLKKKKQHVGGKILMRDGLSTSLSLWGVTFQAPRWQRSLQIYWASPLAAPE